MASKGRASTRQRRTREQEESESEDFESEEEDSKEEKDGNLKWVQCEKCEKWRRLPQDTNLSTLPKKWFCKLNPDVRHNDCSIPEEDEEDPDHRLRAHLRLWVSVCRFYAWIVLWSMFHATRVCPSKGR